MSEPDCGDMQEISAPNGLTIKQESAITAMLTEISLDRVAKAVGVSERTIYNWLRQPEFAAEYHRCRREAFRQSVGLLQRYSSAAVTTLVKIIADANVAPATKVSASVAILRFAREGIELEDLATRIDALEAKVSQPAQFEMAGAR